MRLIQLSEIDSSMIDLVGGKAAGLGEMIKVGERVPDGFCLTVESYASRDLPENELIDAYERLGGGRVAVRSSATAEDLPDASFAGQQDTYLDVEGAGPLLDAVRRCWDSLHTERAVAYRAALGIDETAMAVVVQRMIDPVAAGVLFTANPITGCRTEMIVDAALGLGTAIVEGTVVPDHYVLGHQGPAAPDDGGCLDGDQLEELREAGRRLQESFGSPQDIEWAIDADGTLWLLQSRPITTLFPAPPHTDDMRLYLEFGHIQGMLRPTTPMGVSLLKTASGMWFKGVGATVDPRDPLPRLVPIGGRLYFDLTGFVRNKTMRNGLRTSLEVYGPRVQGAVERMLDDPRFAPRRGLPFRLGSAVKMTARVAPGAAFGLARSLARPDAARARAYRAVQEIKRQTVPPSEPATSAERFRWVVEDSHRAVMSPDMMGIVWPLMAGILAGTVPSGLLKGIAAAEELDIVLGGMPYNVTTEMDLALWQVAVSAREHRDLFLGTPPQELAAKYRAGELPDIGMAGFLDRYGMRAAAEIDVGVARWAEDPAPLFATIANYLRVDDPGQAPDLRFRQAAERAEKMIETLSRRTRRTRPVRGRLATFFMRRSRKLTGLREIGKFAWLSPLQAARRQLLLIGADLVSRGLLERAGDVMFLDLPEVRAAVHDGADHRALVAARRAEYERELRRPAVPGALLSDGTDVEALAPPGPAEDGVLTGMAGAAGRATGRARVIRDPADARIEPGEILVAPTTDPGWTPLFLTTAGLVTETGSPMAHGPTVAREYGIPAVICVRNATHEIKTGQLITIDGAAGTVRIEGNG
ncbi:PEP/pyruvate-binding domain-containing protein [Planomonospora parontospora]|uniref:PEP/pyruvate-binding domain-containing protein n=1 Tax=Planomonospora parontospora TaxID=58119 RepID=UPI001670B1BF|nr:PEP/pyruvate-binding domain-containing protein [Planomonospora parontospora]GGL58891.1 phosphoenolpyruvate synthase [Planomonospora parontospora subsp. antibiotica]GII20240.1 phosphoenolpyruvate synthase [Planomonospora parontospora subsp. antibiotica]